MVVSDDGGMGKLITDILQTKRKNKVMSIASYDTAPEEIETIGNSLDMAIIDFAAVRSYGSRAMMDVLDLLKGENPEVILIGIIENHKEEKVATALGVTPVKSCRAKSLIYL